MSIHGTLQDDFDDWRGKLVADENGRIVAKLANNFYQFLNGHPAMRGVFVMRESKVWLAARPPWIENSGWAAREMAKSDITRTRMWLELMGLRPSLKETSDAIDVVAENNC